MASGTSSFFSCASSGSQAANSDAKNELLFVMPAEAAGAPPAAEPGAAGSAAPRGDAGRSCASDQSRLQRSEGRSSPSVGVA